MPNISTALGLLKVRSHRLEHALARHLSRHTDLFWRDVVNILHTKPYHAWEVLILERHRLYVAQAYIEYERQMLRIVAWHRTQLRTIFARRFTWLRHGQSLTHEDGFSPILSIATIGLALASDTLKKWLSSLGLLQLGWFSKTRAGSPLPLTQTLRKAMQKPKMTVEQVIAAVKPRVQQMKNSLASLSRNAVAVVNTQSVMGTSKRLGCVGFQVHSVLEPATRWRHRVRHRTKYYFKPEDGERGMEECPIPPREADGSLAFNCLCWLTPIWGEMEDTVDDDVVLRVFRRRGLVA